MLDQYHHQLLHQKAQLLIHHLHLLHGQLCQQQLMLQQHMLLQQHLLLSHQGLQLNHYKVRVTAYIFLKHSLFKSFSFFSIKTSSSNKHIQKSIKQKSKKKTFANPTSLGKLNAIRQPGFTPRKPGSVLWNK